MEQEARALQGNPVEVLRDFEVLYVGEGESEREGVRGRREKEMEGEKECEGAKGREGVF